MNITITKVKVLESHTLKFTNLFIHEIKELEQDYFDINHINYISKSIFY